MLFSLAESRWTWLNFSCLALSIINVVSGLLPQVHQEGILRPYRSYADVTLFHYFVPKEVSVATFEFAAFMDNANCPVREVYIYLQHGSYPVMSADNSSFPPNFLVNRTSLSKIVIHSSYQSHDATVFPVHNPLPGSWFATGYLPNWDQKVQQEGLGHKCRYSLGSVALWSQVLELPSIPLKGTTRLTNTKHFNYYKFYIPSEVLSFKILVDGCHFLTSRWFHESSINTSFADVPCIHNVFLHARALPTYKSNRTDSLVSDSKESFYTHEEKLPYTDSYYYLLVVSDTRVSFNITISTIEWPTCSLSTSLLQQFVGIINTSASSASLRDQVARLNDTNTKTVNQHSIFNGSINTKWVPDPDSNKAFECPCVPIFRLTRIKHAQDFSETFLLQGKEWFTTWLALTDSNLQVPVVGTYFELLPFVDIGGTLHINVHLDELLMNATSQQIHVHGCLGIGKPPKTFCCNLANQTISSCCQSGTSLHVSSANLSTVHDAVYVPFPEPEKYFISFKVHCEFQGEIVPCMIPETLISLDIRTQPCASSKTSETPCGSYGYCQEVHKGQFFYTSCRCVGGYRGWGCTDDSDATPDSLLLMTTLLLTVSNIFFIPAVFLAMKRSMWTQALIYCCTMISSTVYHACDQDIYSYCLTRYEVLQFCDFFCSILAFWVTLIAIARSPPEYDSVLNVLGAVVIAIGTEYNRTGLMVFVIPFVMAFSYILISWIYRSVKKKRVVKPKLGTLLLFLPGVLLGGSGLILFAFVETEDNYRYTHSAWHAIIAISLLYLLPKKSMLRLNCGGAAELALVNEFQHNSASPVFFVTSDTSDLLDNQANEPAREEY